MKIEALGILAKSFSNVGNWVGLSSLKPPEEFSLEGDVRENFKRWTGIKANQETSAETKVAILLHTIGLETLEIYNTLDLTD